MAENSNATILVQKCFTRRQFFRIRKRWEQLRNALNTKLITYKDELLMAAAEDNSHLIVLSKENIDKLMNILQRNSKVSGAKKICLSIILPCLSKPRNSGKDYSAIALVIYESHFKHNKEMVKYLFRSGLMLFMILWD